MLCPTQLHTARTVYGLCQLQGWEDQVVINWGAWQTVRWGRIEDRKQIKKGSPELEERQNESQSWYSNFFKQCGWCNWVGQQEPKAFEGSSATCEFIRLFNDFFDALTSCNPLGKNGKTPLTRCNFSTWQTLFESALVNIEGLKDVRGKNLLHSKRQTAFLGFLIGIGSFIHLYDSLVSIF